MTPGMSARNRTGSSARAVSSPNHQASSPACGHHHLLYYDIREDFNGECSGDAHVQTTAYVSLDKVIPMLNNRIFLALYEIKGVVMEGIFIRSRYVFVMESFVCLLTILVPTPESSML